MRDRPARRTSRIRIGELLIEKGIITKEQMDEALRRQSPMGGRLGQNLVALGYLDEATLIEFLSEQLKIPCIDLRKTSIPPEVQRLVPLEMMNRLGVLPLGHEKNSLSLGMTDPTDLDTIKELEFSLGTRVAPMAMAESQWSYAMSFFSSKGWGKETLTKSGEIPSLGNVDYSMAQLLESLLDRKGSDLHLSVGAPPTIRVRGEMVRLEYPVLAAETLNGLIEEILPERALETLRSGTGIDIAVDFPYIGRFRVNVYRQRGNLAAALRYVVEKIPSAKDLNIPPWLADFASRKQGLILVTGPSGHGKSTTLACLIDVINATRRVNVITLEDPIEFVHHHKLSNVNQRELGTDMDTFGEGLKYIFRQDPDVISIGEMRDLESITTALAAAETGHLVLATLHTLSATSTIDRIIDMFPAEQQNQVRNQLADTLLVVFSQRLIPRSDRSGLLLAYEKLANSHRMQSAIRDRRVHLVRSQYIGSQEDFLPMELSLAKLFQRGLISFEEGRKYSEDTKAYELFAKR